MDLKIDNNCIVIFDLDDTLYKEVEYLKSAFKKIAENLAIETGRDIYNEMMKLYTEDKDVFEEIIDNYDIQSASKKDLIEYYRNHIPDINLLPHSKKKLAEIKDKAYALGVLTDGRSKTQRNKLKSLEILHLFDEILISEEFGSQKPAKENYLYFVKKYPGKKFIYIADNISKDFVSANKLKWLTICLKDDGSNIHQQDIKVEPEYLPSHYIKDYCCLNLI